MEYQVPQFIEVEEKIVGPLTLKQFIYLAGSGGLCVVAFVYLPIMLSIIISIPIIALGAALSFYRINGKPFSEVLEAGFNYYTGSKLFLWKRVAREAEAPAVQAAKAAALEATARMDKAGPRLTRGKLSELAWSLDVERPNKPEAPA